jgi:hypothetical protein
VHGEPVKEPELVVAKKTIPVGVIVTPEGKVETVALQVVALPTVMEDGEQVTLVKTL